MPKSRVDYWQEKFRRNVERDVRHAADLLALGWEPVVIWECETADPESLAEIIEARVNGSSAD